MITSSPVRLLKTIKQFLQTFNRSLLASVIPSQICWYVGEANVVFWRPEEERPTVSAPAIKSLGNLVTIVKNLTRFGRTGCLPSSTEHVHPALGEVCLHTEG